MKELSIEEKAKAKAYDEAIEKLKGLHKSWKSTQNRAGKEIESVFPELAESEDERIRKEIMDFVVGNTICKDGRREKYLAWLEKQGEHSNFRNKIQIGDKVTRNEDGVLVNLSQLNRVAKKDENQGEQKETLCDKCRREQPSHSCQDITELGRCAVEYEQKSTDKIEPKFKIGDYVKNVNDKREPIYEIVYMDKECYVCEYRGKENMGDKAVMHFAFENPYLHLVQKPTDEVKPKFKVGDWVIKDDVVSQIMDEQKHAFVGLDTYGNDFVCRYDNINSMRLWTIQDANEGDVLAAHECYVIFKEIDGLNIRCHCTYHYLNSESFYIDTLQNKTAFYPATKEQRDRLEKAMTNAGYKWNKEERKLEKVEYPSTWSEKDEKFLVDTIDFLCKAKNQYAQTVRLQECIDWLKSLKPNHWKPSDEQIKTLEHYMHTLTCNEHKEVLFGLMEQLKKLKSLKPNHWKPSEKQMEALKLVSDKDWDIDGNSPLYTLYNDLKKL